jgi:hypothetical protein
MYIQEQTMRKTKTQQHLSRRGGYVYIVVLMTALVVSTLAMSSVWIARKHQLEQTAADEAYELASAADSAIEFALARIAENSAWRTQHVHNSEYGPFTLGNVSLFYRLLDPNGDVGAGRLRDVTVIGIARRGSSSYAAQVNVTPAGPAVTCLNHGIAINSSVLLSYRTAWMSTRSSFISGNLALDWEASISGTTQATGTISGAFLNGPASSGLGPISYGNISSLDRYIDEATDINITSLPLVWGYRKLSNCLLSPNHNPFDGQLNAKGVYRINCNWENLDIENCRIVGTLILENLGGDSKIMRNVYAQPAIENYPCFYIDGDINIDTRWGNFSESTLGINLNPEGAPYQGLANTTQDDIYPCRIDGLFYCRGRAYFLYLSELDIDGVFVADSSNTGESQISLRVNYDSRIAANPPPGFREDTIMRPIQGTYRRIATP